MRSVLVMMILALAAVGAFGQAETGTSKYQLFLNLTKDAPAAFSLGSDDLAVQYSKDLLKLAPEFESDWNYGNAIHTAHVVLGRVALKNKDYKEAERQLLASVAGPSLPYGMKMREENGVEQQQRPKWKASPQMDSFGPDMALARDLLVWGRTAAVINYLNHCSKFWSGRDNDLTAWTADIKAGKIPDFGPNLRYFFGTAAERPPAAEK